MIDVVSALKSTGRYSQNMRVVPLAHQLGLSSPFWISALIRAINPPPPPQNVELSLGADASTGIQQSTKGITSASFEVTRPGGVVVSENGQKVRNDLYTANVSVPSSGFSGTWLVYAYAEFDYEDSAGTHSGSATTVLPGLSFEWLRPPLLAGMKITRITTEAGFHDVIVKV